MGILKSIPRATYRLQCHREFPLSRAAELAPYLAALGVSHIYLSPPFAATSGSTHGYDVCGFEEINPELGGAEAFEKLSSAAREHGLKLLVDMVPNHMGASLSNRWWRDVLEHGPGSPYARWFDIDWRPRSGDIHDQVLLPVLGDHYAAVLEQGQLQLKPAEGTFTLNYFDNAFPVSRRGWIEILSGVIKHLHEHGTGGVSEELAALVRTAEEAAEPNRYEIFTEVKERMERLHGSSPALREAVSACLARLNGRPGEPRSFDDLHRVVRQQHYRLAFWRVGTHEINYRRFFDVTQLACLRMELPDVFEATHKLAFKLAAKGDIAGLRIDHPDGLRDPKRYFDRLQEAARQQHLDGLYVVAEKILTGDEAVPEDWAVDGTTGYDFLVRLNALFVDASNARALDEVYHRFGGEQTDFRSHVYLGKKRVLENSLVSEVSALARRLKDVCLQTRYGQDFALDQLRRVLVELIASFPVYRTYVTEKSTQPSPVELAQINSAVELVRKRAPDIDETALRFVAALLRLEFPEDMGENARVEAREFVLRFQQLSGPATAKGVEDTAFYRYFRLVSLNEVGGEPDDFGLDPAEFHTHCTERAKLQPHSLLATATHDTKRGEDARARINVLSEMPGEWGEGVLRWADMNRGHKSGQGVPAPDANDEYLFYQALVGAWPTKTDPEPSSSEFIERMTQYMLKALKESKRHTTWTEPNTAYEEGVKQFVRQVLTSEEFVEDFGKFHSPISWFGALNSYSQVLTILGCPGAPDIYQGCELWDFSLVDPDNRRAVDYELRRGKLTALEKQFASGAVNQPASRLPNNLRDLSDPADLKLFVTWKGLQARRRMPDVFSDGSYEPLQVSGAKARHVVAFARRSGESTAIIVVPRLCYTLLNGVQRWPVGAEVWQDTALRLPTGIAPLKDEFTGLECAPDQEGKLRLGRLLSAFPMSLLM